MAGGGGTRFWPLSTRELPKQFLNLSGKDIMINETFDRLLGVVEQEDIFVVTNMEQVHLVHSMTGDRFRRDHILSESAARNTAACIGYAAIEIMEKYGDGIMCIVPSDHFIKDRGEFQNILKQGVEIADKTDRLVTIGIQPTFPSTGYGYIQHDEIREGSAYVVKEFVEKPDVETAKGYLEQGDYLWNSGMFIWKVSVILDYFKRLLPDIYQSLQEIQETFGKEDELEAIQKIYPTIPKISIDYGIMERADHVVVLPADFGWNDVGSYDALDSIMDKDENENIRIGQTIAKKTTNCIVYTTDKLVATIGIQDLVIAQTENAVLVCAKECVQEVKSIVETLEKI